jgi:hypothetical protein
VFISPLEQDFRQTIAILEIFAGASGLRTSIGKCQLTPIRCTLDQVQLVQQIFPYQLVNFPCKYLGVPLSIHELSKADLQPMVNVLADRLPNWKGHLMSRAGRTTSTKVTCLLFLYISPSLSLSHQASTMQLTRSDELSSGMEVTMFKVGNVW